MSNRGYQYPHFPRPPVVVHDHDVLSGRGVNIAHHPGNERFRTLVTTRADESYCTQYSASEKRAVAEEIIKHIQSLDPPGRFLRRDGRGQVARGLNGPWEELSEREAIKKTCQALRDCNRADRQGYAAGVHMPEDVMKEAEQRAQLGLSGKEQAAQAAAAAAAEAEAAASLKRARDPLYQHIGRVSPSVENAAEWLKKQRTDDAMATAAAAAAAVTDFTHSAYSDPQVVAAAAAVYHPNDLLTPAAASTSEDDDAAVAEAAAAAAESDDPNGNGYHHHYQYSDEMHQGGLSLTEL